MKTITIVGDNYFGQWKKTRAACRALVIRDGRMLLSYETKTGQWMLPGGGLEDGESEKTCCARETEEETGFVVTPGECLFEIDEYYEDFKWVNRYFACSVLGAGKQSLTEQEKQVGMEPRWLPLDEIKAVFSRHADYAATDEMRRGIYLREYTALCEWETGRGLK